MSILPTDNYLICNQQNQYAGRRRHEDKSLHPKGVFCPTNDIRPFHIEKLHNGRYIIKAHGAPTGVVHGGVYALLMPVEPEEWNITKLWNGEYIIENGAKTAGWVAPHDSEQHEPIRVRPLTPTRSIPPHYPPSQTWVIRPLVD